ncbi:MAG TPA: hypothetical protein VIM73_15405 [Polyangiaceae bacterium]
MTETKDAVEQESLPATAEDSPSPLETPPAEPGDARADAKSASTEEAPLTEAPRKRKKKKKKATETGVASTAIERPERDEDGNERPRFLLKFPQDPELETLIAAFEAGDYARVRARATALAERTESADVKRAAEELLRRIEPDPLVKFLLLVAIGTFVAIVAYIYYAHG